MTRPGILVRLEAKFGNPHGHVGSTRVKATKQHPQNLRICRRHGTWPGFWQPASVHGRSSCMACSPQSDTSSTPSVISSIAMACCKDWQLRCTSLCRGTACNSSGSRRHRMFSLAMVALLAAVFGFTSAACAQDVPTVSGVEGQVQSVKNYSTQESSSMEAIGLLVMLEARPGKETDAEAFLKSALPLALNENGTLKWYAIKAGPGKFVIFDTFANEVGRNAHLSGEIAKGLGARANELFAPPPQIEKVEILAATPLKHQAGSSRTAMHRDCGIRARSAEGPHEAP
jgi:quinol monooxygenase YgiN